MIINLTLKASIELESIPKFNVELGYCRAPVLYRHLPLFRDVLYYQEHQFHKSLLRAECTFGFLDFMDLMVHSFNWISRINNLTYLFILLEKVERYLFTLRDAYGREVNLKPYLLKFASEVTKRREVLKNVTLDYSTDRKLFLDVENGVLAVKKFSVT